MRCIYSLAAALLLAAPIPSLANVFASVHGVVHDPQHRPIAGAAITLQAADSAFTLRTITNSNGEFELPQTPIGVYRLTIASPGFATVTQTAHRRLRHQPRAAHPLCPSAPPRRL